MKLIHIVENLEKGAVENWLVSVFLNSRELRTEWSWTFYCILGKPGRLDERVRQAGGTIIYAPCSISDKMKFLKHLRTTLVIGQYDIIHAHHDFLSGFYMLAAMGLPGRKLIHVHNNDHAVPVGSQALRKILLPMLRRSCFWLADDIVAISEFTREDFKNNYSGNKPRFHVLYYGIDMMKFDIPADPVKLRMSYGMPADARVLLFTGRMIREKNPVYVVDILNALLQLRPDVYALFIGNGEQREVVLARADELGVQEHVRVVGWSDNIAATMKSVDVFVFPRHEFPKEGLGLVVVEAQCAGLPVFLSHGIVKDAVVIEALACYLNLDDPKDWATQIHKVLNDSPRVSRDQALRSMMGSKFSLNHSTKKLIDLYEN
jgi:glycosyltransferase EpsF